MSMGIIKMDERQLFKDALAQISAEIDASFDALLSVPADSRAKLYEAMRHAAIGGGKRLRPLLLVTVASMHGVCRQTAVQVATALESIHVYSLVHDDLPCMDDDDMRRGKPTVHKAFDEPTAVLAGDCLHALAFEILADSDIVADPFHRTELIHALALASGPQGMAGGQMMDLLAEENDFDLEAISRLQQLKTGALITVSVEMGAILGGLPEERRRPLRAYARDIGLAFQIADDLLDIEGDADIVGKAVQKDEEAGKATFVSLMGLERAREHAHLLIEQAVAHLSEYGAEADILRILARFIIERDH